MCFINTNIHSCGCSVIGRSQSCDDWPDCMIEQRTPVRWSFPCTPCITNPAEEQIEEQSELAVHHPSSDRTSDRPHELSSDETPTAPSVHPSDYGNWTAYECALMRQLPEFITITDGYRRHYRAFSICLFLVRIDQSRCESRFCFFHDDWSGSTN